MKVNYATKILERSIADVGKLLRKSSMVVECLNVAGNVLEQSNNARRSVTSMMVKYSAVRVIFDGTSSINDVRNAREDLGA